MLAGILVFNFPSAKIFAAEETVVTDEIVTTLVNTETTSTIDETEVTDVTEEIEETDVIEETDEIEEADNETIAEDTEDEDSQATENKEAKVTEKKENKVIEAQYTKDELRLLSALIYCEANGESYQGKLAVGIVVMNRKRSGAFPDTVEGVIYQKCQFGPASNGSLDSALSEYDKGKFTSTLEKNCIKAAKEALNGTKYITVNDTKKNMSKYLFFSVTLRGHTFELGNHKFK